MKELGLKELQEIELRLLKQIDALCRRENIRYFMAAGSLLGAVREKGFIPWDDDIDLVMPRPDYERFVRLCREQEQPFRLCCLDTEKNYGYTYAKVWAPDTVIREREGNRGGVDMGVFVDIFPADGAGNSMEEALEKVQKTRRMHSLLVAANWKKYSPSKTHGGRRELFRLGAFLLTRFTSPAKLARRLDAAYKSIPYDSSAYSFTPMCLPARLDIVPRAWMDEALPVPFEDGEYPAPAGYEGWLELFYHDYMTPPPPEKRVTHHSFDAYWRAEMSD